MPPPVAPAGGWGVAAVADRVGISVSTLRSWESRYGLHPHGRTAGGHRRYTAADVATLQQVHRLVATGMPTGAAAAAVQAQSMRTTNGAEPLTARFPDDSQEACERLHQAATRLDATAAARLAGRLLSRRGAVAAWTDVFTPVLQYLGRRWQDTGEGVHREHLVVGVLQAALDRHTSRHARHGGEGGPVLLAATPLEGHTLPLQAIAAALAERGVPSDVFGSLPADALRAAIDQLTPTAVLVWARSRQTARVRQLSPLTRRAPLVCAAGIGWPIRLPQAIAGTRDLTSTIDLLVTAAN